MAESVSGLAGGSSQPSIADTFKDFLGNLALDNEETISLRYGEVACALNKKFRDTESRTANSLQVGSYGRKTAIKGISDLDMLYIMPAGSWDGYKNGGQSLLLRDTADAISTRYPATTVKVDRLVVQVLYTNFQIEVQPVFEEEDGSFTYPDTYNGGRWKVTKPREELAAMADTDAAKNRNLRRLCRMARAWKNKHGVGMGGLLIDTLAHRFLTSTTEYDEKSYLYYDWMVRDFFEYLAELDPDQTEYGALGSGQRVKVKKRFQAKAKKAHRLVKQAIEAEDQAYRNDRWRKVFGRPFPPRSAEVKKAAFVAEGGFQARNTEEFIEDRYPVDVRYSIRIDCEVTQTGFRTFLLRKMLVDRLPLYTRKSLRFFVTAHSIPPNSRFELFWKVLNRGPEAHRRNQIRGEITLDRGQLEKSENTLFRGDHVVECYAVYRGVVVAKDRIHVPIEPDEES